VEAVPQLRTPSWPSPSSGAALRRSGRAMSQQAARAGMHPAIAGPAHVRLWSRSSFLLRSLGWRPASIAAGRGQPACGMFKNFTSGLDKGKTFRPRRNHREGTKRYQLHKFAQVRAWPRGAERGGDQEPAGRLASPVRAGHPGDREPARGGDAPGRRGRQRVARRQHGASCQLGRLWQPRAGRTAGAALAVQCARERAWVTSQRLRPARPLRVRDSRRGGRAIPVCP
jgi:hypothetical protein